MNVDGKTSPGGSVASYEMADGKTLKKQLDSIIRNIDRGKL